MSSTKHYDNLTQGQIDTINHLSDFMDYLRNRPILKNGKPVEWTAIKEERMMAMDPHYSGLPLME